MKFLSYSHNPNGLFQIRVLQVTAIKNQASTDLHEYKVKSIKSSFDKQQHQTYSLSMNGGWAHLPTSESFSYLKTQLKEQERLKQGSLISHSFTALLILHNNPQIKLLHNEVQKVTLTLKPSNQEDKRPSAIQKFELECELAFVSALSPQSSGIPLNQEEGYFETHPFMLQIPQFRLAGLGSFFESNMIIPGKEADYFLVIGDDLTDPANNAAGTVREIKLTQEMIEGSRIKTELIEGVEFYAAQDFTPGSVFYIAIVEKPKIAFMQKNVNRFLNTIDLIAKGSAFSVESYLNEFSGKKMEECADEQEMFYYDEENCSIILHTQVNTRDDLPQVSTNYGAVTKEFNFDESRRVKIEIAVGASSSSFLDFPFGKLLLDIKSTYPFGDLKKPCLLIQSGSQYSSGPFLGLFKMQGGVNKVSWVSEDTGKPKVIQMEVLGAAQKISFILFNSRIGATTLQGYSDIKVTQLIKQNAGTAHVPLYTPDHRLLGSVRLAYKFAPYYPSLMREFSGGWREVALLQYQGLRRGGALKPQCQNDFSTSIPYGVLSLSLQSVRNLQDFLAKVKHDPSLPLIMAVRLNGQVKYISLKQFEKSRRSLDIYLQTLSHNDKLEFELVQPKTGSSLAALTTEQDLNIVSILTRLHSSNSLSSDLRILKHEQIDLCTLFSLTSDGYYSIQLCLQDLSCKAGFPVFCCLVLEFTLNYEPTLMPQDSHIPVGNIANFPFSVMGISSHVLSKEEGYLNSHYTFTYAVNRHNIAEVQAVASSKEHPRLKDRGVSFQLYFEQNETFLVLEVAELRGKERPIVFRQDINLGALSTQERDGKMMLALWQPLTLCYNCTGEQLGIEPLTFSERNPSHRTRYSSTRIGLPLQSGKFSESLLAFKRTGKLPRTPHKSSRSERSLFGHSASQQRSPTLRRIATATRTNQPTPLQLLCSFSLMTSDFIQNKGKGTLFIYFDQVSLLELYNAKIITEKSSCGIRLISKNEESLDTVYKLSVLDIDTTLPFTLDTYELSDTAEITIEKEEGNEETEVHRVKLKLSEVPLNKERFEYHLIVANEHFQLGLEYQVKYEEALISSAEELVLSQRSKFSGKAGDTLGVSKTSGEPKRTFGKVDLNQDLKEQIQRLKGEIIEVDRRGVEQHGRLQRVKAQVSENKRKIKELEAVKVENPNKLLSFLSLQSDLVRMRKLMGEGKKGGSKENEEVNLADTPQYRENLRRDFLKTYNRFEPLAQEFQLFSQDRRVLVLEKKKLMERKIENLKLQLQAESHQKLDISDFLQKPMASDTTQIRRDVVKLQNKLEYEEREHATNEKDLHLKNRMLVEDSKQKILQKEKLEKEIGSLKEQIKDMEKKIGAQNKQIEEKKAIVQNVHSQ